MGLYVKGALGAFHGTVGNVVGSNWRAIDYLKSRPRPSKKKATELQMAQRAKFAKVMDFLAPIRPLINIGMNDKGRSKVSAYNHAATKLIGKMEGQYPDFVIPYEDVTLSNGTLSNVDPVLEISAEGNVEVTWGARNNVYSSSMSDMVCLIFYEEAANDFFIVQEAIREDRSVVINADEIGQGEFQIWVLMLSPDNKQRSGTRYCGSVST